MGGGAVLSRQQTEELRSQSQDVAIGGRLDVRHKATEMVEVMLKGIPLQTIQVGVSKQ